MFSGGHVADRVSSFLCPSQAINHCPSLHHLYAYDYVCILYITHVVKHNHADGILTSLICDKSVTTQNLAFFF
jgi:hypothetical protein